MYFKEAINRLELSGDRKKSLHKLLIKWTRAYPNEMTNLAKERFLSRGAMKFLVLHLSEIPDHYSIEQIKDSLRRHFYSWLQLSGEETSLASQMALLGIVIPVNRLKNSFLKRYPAYFPDVGSINKFLMELEFQTNPHDFLVKKNRQHLCVRDPSNLNWFFWSSTLSTPDPFDLPNSLTSAELRKMLRIPYDETYRELALLTYRYDKGSTSLSNWELCRPTWVDADFVIDFHAPHPSQLVGVANDSYFIEDKKEVIAEGVSRSGFVYLKDLVKFKILP